MKNLFKLIALVLILVSCKQEVVKQIDNKPVISIAPVSDAMMEKAVIYEANIRQYSPEGSFNAFTKDIPVLKELGVKIIWVMPINPISKIKRKATGEVFTSEIADEKEREKYLGSYYSVSDYKAINPEFGTLDDFKNMVQVAHENGIYLIIDWVPNHTGWDHPWITAHPDWYTQDKDGNIIDPIDPGTGKSWGWTDVADLNYDNQDMRAEMIADMKYWVTEADVDGFRVDVAHNVPVDFFEKALAELRKEKPLFMLAEAEKHELFRVGYDMGYAWEGHHLLNKMAKGEANGVDFEKYIEKQKSLLQPEDFNMNFVTNHDENSWGGTLSERMPNSKELFTALTYVMPGMPLIYSGQEYDLDHRLKFFEKDQIPKTKGAYFELLRKLGQLKIASNALNGGKDAASYSSLNGGEDLIAFSRTKGRSSISFVGNISNKVKQFKNLQGSYKDFLNNTKLELSNNQPLELKPWEFKILLHSRR